MSIIYFVGSLGRLRLCQHSSDLVFFFGRGSVGFGDICPGDTNAEGKLFLLLFSLAGLGFFCGPIVQLGAAWRHAIPGGLTALATFVLGLGVTIFTTVEGLDHVEAMYASIITGKAEYIL